MRYFYTYFAVSLSVLLLSCDSNQGVKGSDSSGSEGSFLSTFRSIAAPKPLTREEYTIWVKEQEGLTYANASNDQFSISLVFHPAQLEAYSAAAANGENPKNALSRYLEIQKDFYYCTAECTIKSESASNPIKKTDLLNTLKQQLTVVKNKDTLSNVITEAFPSYVMNQPNKLLILIPNTDSLSKYQITINGAAFHLNDCQLNLTSEDIQSFPLIKL